MSNAMTVAVAPPSVESAMSELRRCLRDAEATEIQRRLEYDQAANAVGRAKALLSDATREVRRLTSALNALDRAGRPGRKNGSGDPLGTRERLRAILPMQSEWTNAQLRSALERETGRPTPAAHVSSALSTLREQGAARRVGRGRWTASEAAPSDTSDSPSDDRLRPEA